MTNSDTQQILEMYASGKMTTTAIAKQFSLSTKTIQRIAQEGGCFEDQGAIQQAYLPTKKAPTNPKAYFRPHKGYNSRTS
jgi:hypothetical protein